MIRKLFSVSKTLAVSGLVAATFSGSALAESDEVVLERIRPIGRVNVTKPAAPAPAPAAAPAPAPAPAPVAAAEPAAAPAPAPVAAAEPAPAAGGAAAGEAIYKQACFICHMAGVSGAPKLGDKAAWEPRIAKGMDALVQSSINGIAGTAMPPRGTCATCSDDDLKAAVEYMVSQAQ